MQTLKMKAERVFLDELNSTSKAYKVKVKVIEKGRPKVSPKKGTVYQNLLLEDDKGNRMRGALFGDQVEGYKEAFVYKGEYEIANAPIKPMEEQWKSNPSELNYQMSFGRQTVIQPVDAETNPLLPDYQNIASIPKAGNPNEKFDVLGVVLYVEEAARTIVTSNARESKVREIVIADHSTQQPLVISAWNDLAGEDCDRLTTWAEKFKVVGITALKVTSHKGFSLATTMSTTIVHEPQGDKATALAEWALRHRVALADKQARILDVRFTSKEKVIMQISDLKLKTPLNTLQEERIWFRVAIPQADFEKVHAYPGCSTCGKRTDVPISNGFTCPTCFGKDVISVPKVTFNCEVSDGTGTLPVTLFTSDSEKLFKMPVEDIFRLKHSDDQQAFAYIQEHLSSCHFLIQVGPKTTLSCNNVLQWILTKVVLEDEATEDQSTPTIAVEPKDNIAAQSPEDTPPGFAAKPVYEDSN